MEENRAEFTVNCSPGTFARVQNDPEKEQLQTQKQLIFYYYRGLERTYKKSKAHNNKTGRNRESCPYERELGEILEKHDSVFPQFILGRRTDLQTRKENLLPNAGGSSGTADEDALVSTQECSSLDNSNELSNRKPSKQNARLLEELEGMRADRKKFQEELLEQVKEKNKTLKERNEILKDLVNYFKK